METVGGEVGRGHTAREFGVSGAGWPVEVSGLEFDGHVPGAEGSAEAGEGLIGDDRVVRVLKGAADVAVVGNRSRDGVAEDGELGEQAAEEGSRQASKWRRKA